MMYLPMRGYPTDILQNALIQVNKMTQCEALKSNHKEKMDNPIHCILDYNPLSPKMKLS